MTILLLYDIMTQKEDCMYKRILLLTVCPIIFLSGCGTSNNQNDYINKDEYESIISEMEELKSQIASIEENNNQSSEVQSEKENEEQELNNQIMYEKELLGEGTFEWDENNLLYLAVYHEGAKTFSLVGYGIYEDDNFGLLQEDYFIINSYGGDWLKNLEVSFSIGEEEYLYLKSDGELISEGVPMDERVNIQQKYNKIERRNIISVFYYSIFDKIVELTK